MHQKRFLLCCNKAGLASISKPWDMGFSLERPFGRYGDYWALVQSAKRAEKEDIPGNLNRMETVNNVKALVLIDSQVQVADLCGVSSMGLSALQCVVSFHLHDNLAKRVVL